MILRMLPMSVKINLLGTGSAIPANILKSGYFDAKLGKKCGTLAAATGVFQRPVCKTETQIDLAIDAIENAVETAGINLHDVDLVVSACGIPYQTLPATAPLVMGRLGLPDGRASAFDVNSTCLSFLTGVETAYRLLVAEQYRTAIVFSSEVASRALPWDKAPETAALFGDGAAAVVLGRTDETVASGLRASLLRTYPSAYDACSIAAGGTRFDFHQQQDEFVQNAVFHMDGKILFRIASKYLKGFVDELLEKAQWKMDEIDLVIPHQASPFALRHMIKVTGFDTHKVVDISRNYGNQIAASIPFALNMAWRDGRIKPGSKLVFLGTSAGVSLGGMAWEV